MATGGDVVYELPGSRVAHLREECVRVRDRDGLRQRPATESYRALCKRCLLRRARDERIQDKVAARRRVA